MSYQSTCLTQARCQVIYGCMFENYAKKHFLLRISTVSTNLNSSFGKITAWRTVTCFSSSRFPSPFSTGYFLTTQQMSFGGAMLTNVLHNDTRHVLCAMSVSDIVTAPKGRTLPLPSLPHSPPFLTGQHTAVGSLFVRLFVDSLKTINQQVKSNVVQQQL